MTRYHDGTTNVSYTYYPDNMRKSKKVGNVTTTHVWFDNEIALDMTDGNMLNYIHGLKLIVSDYGWYHYNAHGDVVQLSGNNGDVTRDYDYDPYGNIIHSTSGTDNNPYRYCGEYYDTETGFTYLRARYYDPNIGRFISDDPALNGINWYSYCGNDPIDHIDPSGLKAHKAYNTAIKAAEVWAKKNYGVTSYVRMERSSFIYQIYKSGVPKFAYTPVITGDPHKSTGMWNGAQKIPKDGKMVAYIHSHPNSKNFSPADKTIAKDRGLVAYVVVPGSKKTTADLKSYYYGFFGYWKWERTEKSNITFNPLSKSKKASLVKK